jgi:hypothetical protein
VNQALFISMSYLHIAEQNPSLAGFACGGNCHCDACRSPRVGLAERYIQGLGYPLAEAKPRPKCEAIPEKYKLRDSIDKLSQAISE